MDNLTHQQASRFLDLATMGVRQSELDDLKLLDNRSLWIDEQINQSYMSHLPQAQHQATIRNNGNVNQECRVGAWFDIALWDNAQLRQRVAFALSQIFVVSEKDANLAGDAEALANYYDALVEGAFGNFKQLLRTVTLSPAMGQFLTMSGNKPQSVTGQAPDQNYAREVMQLFTIGLYELNLDGSPDTHPDGTLIETYEDYDVENIARIFTGWDLDNGNTLVPMVADNSFHDMDEKWVFGQYYPPGQTAEQDLDQFLKQITEHQNIAPFISTMLIKRLTTSNPSGDYVYRVASEFANTDGDLQAVIKAIYTDPDTLLTNSVNMAKVREPILAMTYLYRALEAYPGGNGDIVYNPMNYKESFNQYPLGANSVFNFYQPTHIPQGALADQQLTAPELEIIDWGQLINMNNVFYRTLKDFGQNRENSSNRQELYVAPSNLETLANNNNFDALLNAVNTLVLNGNASPEILNLLAKVYDGHNNKFYAVHKMLFIAFVSPDFMVQE
ncbi:DUF1800 domain-containing protein [Vibrio sp. ZSDE26]|uniref:DUF1800 domain-containing protein n=1 Tax=Vibrio amylolyticus TaxID=2847292 RepID=A0A9X1XML7_9VIBR|nr:DUF1800 family protein [Vibrio amylolyticus]MCK6265516.1 DUF1800 domain-containing protein [Vibrio amylolyticus]